MLVHNRLISSVNGPGRRAVIWFQGCTLGCRGCWNPKTHSFAHPDNETPASLAAWVLDQPAIEGVTFSGGEPMQQAADLLRTIYNIRKARPELSVGIFTGYNLQELETGRFRYRVDSGERVDFSASEWVEDAQTTLQVWMSIKPHLDFAVTGRFQESKLDLTTPMRGSSNQRLHLFSTRYREGDFPNQAVEIRIQPGGRSTITGFPIGICF